MLSILPIKRPVTWWTVLVCVLCSGATVVSAVAPVIDSAHVPAFPHQWPPPGGQAFAGDPVDLETGLYERANTDFLLDGHPQIRFDRTYRTQDDQSRPFGIGTNHSYGIFLWTDSPQLSFVYLILENGSRARYDRVSPGTGHENAVFEHVSTPSKFYRSRLAWNGRGWALTLIDGTTYTFGAGVSLQALQAIRYPDGGSITIRYDGGHPPKIVRIASSSGRSIVLTYDTRGHVIRARAGLSAMRTYQYDSEGHLIKVRRFRLDAWRDLIQALFRGGFWWWLSGLVVTEAEYTYDAAHRMRTIKDSNLFITNDYDGEGRVIKQTTAGYGTFTFAYTVDGEGKVVQTDVIRPDGQWRQVTFNAAGYAVSDTYDVGKASELSVRYAREPRSQNVLRITVTCMSAAGVRITVAAPGTPGESGELVERRLIRSCTGATSVQ